MMVYFFGLRSLSRHFRTDIYFGNRAEIKSMIFGALVGLVEDMLTGSIIGPNFFSKGLIGFLTVVIFTEVVFKWTLFLGVIILAFFTMLDEIIVAGFRVIFTGMNIDIIDVLKTTVMQIVVSIPFGIILKPKKFRLTS
ncbi:hypothetical protein A45J_1146 [hot springs metagenome]|uniref:Rod shape-determining protein MreD n=1 Tax=hot springs metagenome TaxID=433727 RepID=A0A5J4L768_9ZZZZ